MIEKNYFIGDLPTICMSQSICVFYNFQRNATEIVKRIRPRHEEKLGRIGERRAPRKRLDVRHRRRFRRAVFKS